jgi:outer membrane protein assembly factor BamB
MTMSAKKNMGSMENAMSKKTFGLFLVLAGALALAASNVVWAQDTAPWAQDIPGATTLPNGVTLIPLVKSDVSPPLRTIKPLPSGPPHEMPEPGTSPEFQSRFKPLSDPVVQNWNAPMAMPAVTTFEGDDTEAGTPPDTNGDIGLTQYVETVNTSFEVFNRTGTILYGPATINTIFSGFGGGCEVNNDGDPVVKYDRRADRWVISQFSVSSTPYLQCIAVSQTNDATGAWYRYSYSFGTRNFNDYPKIGVWPDAYYFANNIFANGRTFSGATACAYDRTNMLTNTGVRATQCFGPNAADYSMLPSDMDGPTNPPAGEPDFFLELNTGTSLTQHKFHVDFVTPGNSTFGAAQNITVAAYTQLCNGGTCVPQSGTAQQNDSLADRLMYRLAYRNMGSYESLVVTHSVNPGTGGGIRWYEIRSPATTPAVFQQGTFAPDASYRWMGSAAMDHMGDIAAGYSISSSAMHPSINYAGRLVGDPAGLFSQGEATMFTGPGSNTGPYSRWGDYSAMQIDPADDCSFWYVQEYYPATGNSFSWHTRVGHFKFPSCSVCTPPPVPTGITATPGTNQITVGWAVSAGATSYNIYRSNGACPGGAFALIGSASPGSATSYVDSTAVGGSTYSYKVTAVGSCESAQSVCASATALACSINPPATVTATATADAQITVTWTAAAGAVSYTVKRAPGACPGGAYATIASGVVALSYVDNTVTPGSTYSYEIVTVGASCSSANSACANAVATGVYSSGMLVSGRPQNTTSAGAGFNTRWIFNTNASALAPPGVRQAVYATSNDRYLNSMAWGNGAGGGAGTPGTWPTSPSIWKPFIMNGPAQARPPIVATSAVTGGSGKYVFLASQDGHIYCVDANTGAQIWQSTAPSDYFQGAANGMFSVFGGAYNLIIVGTRNSSAANVIYGLNVSNGSTAWSFNNGGGANSIGIISSGAQIDYTNNKAYFTSRTYAGGSQQTVWCLSFTGAAAAPCTGWAPPAIGNVDSAPMLFNGRLYIGDNTGRLWALSASTGAALWTGSGNFFATSDGPIKAFISSNFATSATQLYFSTNGKLWAVTDNGTTVAATAGWPVTTITNPSASLYLPGPGYLLAGSSDGALHQINVAGMAQVSATLGSGLFTVGSPTMDTTNNLVYVGTTGGDVYAAVVPLQ